MIKKIGHYSTLLLPWAGLASAVLSLLNITDAAVTRPVSLVFVGTLIAHLCWHPGLCGPCVSRAPLDGSARAEKHRRLLLVFHRATPAVVVIYLLSALAALYVMTMIFDLWGTYVLDLMLTASTTLPLVVMVWIALLHSRLVPWCPYCRWGRGGDDGPTEVVPDPDRGRWKPSPA